MRGWRIIATPYWQILQHYVFFLLCKSVISRPCLFGSTNVHVSPPFMIFVTVYKLLLARLYEIWAASRRENSVHERLYPPRDSTWINGNSCASQSPITNPNVFLITINTSLIKRNLASSLRN